MEKGLIPEHVKARKRLSPQVATELKVPVPVPKVLYSPSGTGSEGEVPRDLCTLSQAKSGEVRRVSGSGLFLFLIFSNNFHFPNVRSSVRSNMEPPDEHR